VLSSRPDAVYGATCQARAFYWHREIPAIGTSLMAQVRYRQKPVTAILEMAADDSVRVHFAEPVFGITPGQSLVLYDGDCVLGGGVIEAGLVT
jgi:tRNA-specific 2-thiouridylase